jgi:NTP pyrophosphatase (non-canonical NTP hydrolase)
MNRQEIYAWIDEERDSQDLKWGPNRRQNPHTWLSILVEEVGEVAKAILQNNTSGLCEELIQCCAVIIAWLESIQEENNDGKNIGS